MLSKQQSRKVVKPFVKCFATYEFLDKGECCHDCDNCSLYQDILLEEYLNS